MRKEKLIIVDDLPTIDDLLDFRPYVETLYEVITSPDTKTPLTIGIFGSWGAGKTSLMKQLERRLITSEQGYWTVWFDAWKYEERATLWRALLLRVLQAMRENLQQGENDKQRQRRKRGDGQGEEQPGGVMREIDDLMVALYHPVEREEIGDGIVVDAKKIAEGTIELGISALLPFWSMKVAKSSLTNLFGTNDEDEGQSPIGKILDAFQRQRTQVFVEHIRFLEQFQDKFHDIVQYVPEKLVVFIDDLDRCMPKQSIEILEALKLFLDVPKSVFVLALDDALITQAVEVHYRQFLSLAESEEQGKVAEKATVEGGRYLEKVIQLPFHLPPFQGKVVEKFIESLLYGGEEESVKVFKVGLMDNPRRIKRAVNTFVLLRKLAQKKEGDVEPELLAKMIVIQLVLPELYNQLKKDGDFSSLQRLEAFILAEKEAEMATVPASAEIDSKARRIDQKQEDISREFKRFLQIPGFSAVRRVLAMGELRFGDLTPVELQSYFTLAHHTEVPQRKAEITIQEAVLIPETVQVDGDFFIGRYPVTNQEYQAFLKATRHTPPSYWDGLSFPEGKAHHPVVHVSAKDAAAYCQWLTEQTNDRYTLPTVEEWEKAAGGKKRRYPWGKEFEQEKCNTKEAGIGDTTPVGQYSPDGDSPCGCADMIGNVWEWTCSRAKETHLPVERRLQFRDDEQLALRGGSFESEGKGLSITTSVESRPFTHFRDLGFRVVKI